MIGALDSVSLEDVSDGPILGCVWDSEAQLREARST